MSQMGQKAKYSLRADVFRFTPESGLKSDIGPCPFRANTRRQLHLQAFSSSLAWPWFQTSENVR